MASLSKDLKLLWGRSGNRCAICRTELSFDGKQTSSSFPLGEQAHIVAEQTYGPRGSSDLTQDQRNRYDNLILLCPNHHTEIDKNIADWPVERLQKIKSIHESWVREKLSAKILNSIEWQSAIQQTISDIKIYGVVHDEPTLQFAGPYILNDEQTAARDILRATTEVNDPHAMLIQEPELLHSPVRLQAHTLDYATLEILRKENKHQHIVSAGAVIVCPEARTLVFHHRSPHSRTFPDRIHTVGGAYRPPGVQPGDFDLSLKSAAQHKVRAETNAVITCDNCPPMLLAAEISERFFQFVFLGADISVNQLKSMKENWQGAGIVKVSFDQLRGFLVAPPRPWVPTGKAHILAWLALGAPGAGRRPKFGKLSAQMLFDEVVSLTPSG